MAEPATITSTAPLLVRLDSSASPSPALKIDTYTTPVVGDRVAVTEFKSRLLILGKVL